MASAPDSPFSVAKVVSYMWINHQEVISNSDTWGLIAKALTALNPFSQAKQNTNVRDGGVSHMYEDSYRQHQP